MLEINCLNVLLVYRYLSFEILTLFIFSLHHSRAYISPSIQNISIKDSFSECEIENVDIILYFSSMPENVHNDIKSEACMFSIKGPRASYATAELDNETLLSEVRLPKMK